MARLLVEQKALLGLVERLDDAARALHKRGLIMSAATVSQVATDLCNLANEAPAEVG